MIRFTQGNLLEADTEAVVNTVNTVGVMGKGIALMFKERFPENFHAYAAACKRGDVRVGHMFVTASTELHGPRWIVNFPTKQHWRHPSRIEWIVEGLADLKDLIARQGIRSIAIPPLGSGNGGLDWETVRRLIVSAFNDVDGLEVVVYEPTSKYQNVKKGHGVETLNAGLAVVAEIIHRYGVLGFECSILEAQKLVWLLSRTAERLMLIDPLRLRFTAGPYGPYAQNLTHVLDELDGSYLHCDRRIADARPFDEIRVDDGRLPQLAAFFKTSAGAPYVKALDVTDNLIDGFQSPLGMEALATVDWLISHDRVPATPDDIRAALARWPGEPRFAERKQRLLNTKLLQVAIDRLRSAKFIA